MNTLQICIGQKYLPLYNYFRASSTAVIKLSFEKIEEIIGSKFSKVAYTRREFWFRRGLNTISQCWLDNSYYITDVNFKKEQVTFQLEVTNRKTVNVDVPDLIANKPIPAKAKYKLKNFYKYLVKKYWL